MEFMTTEELSELHAYLTTLRIAANASPKTLAGNLCRDLSMLTLEIERLIAVALNDISPSKMHSRRVPKRDATYRN